MVKGVEAPLKEIKGLDVDQADFATLKKWSQWCSGVDASITKSEKALKYGIDLLQHDNLSKLALLLTDENDKKRFDEYIKSIAL